MIRYTTPTLTFKLPFESSYVAAAYITIEQRNFTLEKTLDDCEVGDDSLSVTLTQEDTGDLEAKTETLVQLRCKGTDSKAYASKKFKIEIDDVLKDGII